MDEEVRADVRRYGTDLHGFIGYIRGLIGSGNDPHATRLAVVALNEHHLIIHGGKA